MVRVEFESDENRFIFNAQRKIDRIVPLVRNDAHKLIEECMIQQNVAAAKFMKNKKKRLFRVRDRPGELKLETFRPFLGELGLELKVVMNRANALRGISRAGAGSGC